VVRNSGQGTLGFDLDIRSPNPVFVMAIAANDNGESSSISLNGQPFVSRSGCCASYRQTSLDGVTSLQIQGNKSWSYVNPAITMVVQGGSVGYSNAFSSPRSIPDLGPLLITLSPGITQFAQETAFREVSEEERNSMYMGSFRPGGLLRQDDSHTQLVPGKRVDVKTYVGTGAHQKIFFSRLHVLSADATAFRFDFTTIDESGAVIDQREGQELPIG